MPVLLTVKVIPRSGYLTTLAKKQISKYHSSLNRILHIISENISVDFIGLFECKPDSEEYYLSLVVVRSYPGHDTKETMKPFLDYLDNDKTLQMDLKQITYSVKLTSRVRMWLQLQGNVSELKNHPNLAELDSEVQNPTELYSNSDIFNAYIQKFQVLSPLLYCKQIQLNNTEFEEKDSRLIADVASRKIAFTYYRRVPPSMARVCADHYMNKPQNMGVQTKNLAVQISCLSVFVISRCFRVWSFQFR